VKRRLRAILLGLVGPLVLAFGCGGAMPADRAACFAAATATAHSERNLWCKGVKWEACESRPAILDRLRESEERCP
jgi:hypothetical protein